MKMESIIGNGLVRRDRFLAEFSNSSAEIQWRSFDNICFTLLSQHGGGIDPLSTTLRAVSGKKKKHWNCHYCCEGSKEPKDCVPAEVMGEQTSKNRRASMLSQPGTVLD